MKVLYAAAVSILTMSATAHGQAELTIDSFSGNGQLSWSNYPGAKEYRVEWAPRLEVNRWTNSWDKLNGIEATGTYYTVEVPMFYRIVSVMPDYTRLLLHCDGSEGSSNFPDATSNHTVQVAGDIAVSGAMPKFGTGSAVFDGTLDHWLSIPDAPEFTPGHEPFTIDFWMYPTDSAGGQYIMGKSYPDSGRGYDIRYFNSGIYTYGLNGWSEDIGAPSTVSTGSWHHIAIVCETNQITLFVNGTMADTAARGNIADTTDDFHIGDTPGFGGSAYHGYLDEIRFSLGIARWTNDFVVPSAPWTDD